MSAAQKLLDRLPRVRQTRPDHYIAGCPCCQSRHGRPIKVTTANYRVLLHAFCGCTTGDVLAALGLNLADLFDTPLAHHNLPPIRGGFNARELIELVAHEATVAWILIVDATGRTLTEAEQTRLGQAAARIGTAKALANE
jgi:hypothetical protein